MHKQFLMIAGALSVLMTSSSGAAAQALEGRVIDAGTGAALTHVDVLILGETGDTVANVRAAGDGIYQLRLRSGTFRVLLSQRGYETAVYESVVVPPGELINLPITSLTPLPAAQGSATPRGSPLEERRVAISARLSRFAAIA
jgi:hypothetical protein